MGDVRESVKGSGSRRSSSTSGAPKNLIQRFEEVMGELDGLVQKKDEDARTEGKDKEAENMASAARLRAVLGLVRNAKTILEDY